MPMLLWAALTLHGAPALAAPPIMTSAIAIEPWGYYDSNSSPTGMYVELALAVAREAGLEAKTSLKPYARAVLDMQTGQSVFGFMFASPELNASAVAAMPLHELDLLVITPARQTAVRLDAIAGRSVATLQGTPFGAILADKQPVHLKAVKSPEQQLLMLMLGRVDAVLGVRESTELAFEKLHASGRVPLDGWRSIEVSKVRAYLYISKKHYSDELHNRLTNALSRLLARGDIERIVHKYALAPSSVLQTATH